MQQRQLTTSTTHWAQELLMNIQGSGGSRNVAKGSDSLEEEEHGGWPSEFDNDQLRGSLKLILLQLHEKLPKNSMLTILWLFSIWTKLERWKSSISWCLMSGLQIKKNHCFEVSSSLILGNNNKPFFDQILTFNEKWISYDNQVSGWTKKQLQSTSQSQACTRKRSWSLFGGLLLVSSTTAFWIRLKPLHLRSMLSKSVRYTDNC